MRHMKRNWGYSLINILGLAIGLQYENIQQKLLIEAEGESLTMSATV